MIPGDIRITGMGYEHPPHELSNGFFESLDIGTTAEWIEDRTGIKSRRSILDPKTIEDLRYRRLTIQQLMEQGRIQKLSEMSQGPLGQALIGAGLSNESKIDLVIAGTSVFDHEIPSSACMIAGDLRIEALAFDVNSACSSFIADLHVARSLLATASAKRIAIFNAERYSTRVDFTDRTSCILFGDGAAATIVETDVDKPGLKVIDTIMESDPSSHGLVKIPLYSTFTQQGSAVQKFAIHKTMAITQKILARNHLTVEQVRFFVGHQANLRMVSSAASKLGFQGDQHLFNVDLFGNQGGAGAPTVLAEHWTEFRNGDYIVVSVVGSGLTWGSALFQKV